MRRVSPKDQVTASASVTKIVGVFMMVHTGMCLAGTPLCGSCSLNVLLVAACLVDVAAIWTRRSCSDPGTGGAYMLVMLIMCRIS